MRGSNNSQKDGMGAPWSVYTVNDKTGKDFIQIKGPLLRETSIFGSMLIVEHNSRL
jgi:hypothetical protein